ncbi:MAG: hypothetical protein AABZ64_09455 [Nitrospinota bacterium]
MIRAGAGLSALPSTPEAARQAVEEALREARLGRAALLFLTAGHLPRFPEARREAAAEALPKKVPGLPAAGFSTGAGIAPIGGHGHLHPFPGALVLLGENPGVR